MLFALVSSVGLISNCIFACSEALQSMPFLSVEYQPTTSILQSHSFGGSWSSDLISFCFVPSDPQPWDILKWTTLWDFAFIYGGASYTGLLVLLSWKWLTFPTCFQIWNLLYVFCSLLLVCYKQQS